MPVNSSTTSSISPASSISKAAAWPGWLDRLQRAADDVAALGLGPFLDVLQLRLELLGPSLLLLLVVDQLSGAGCPIGHRGAERLLAELEVAEELRPALDDRLVGNLLRRRFVTACCNGHGPTGPRLGPRPAMRASLDRPGATPTRDTPPRSARLPAWPPGSRRTRLARRIEQASKHGG